MDSMFHPSSTRCTHFLSAPDNNPANFPQQGTSMPEKQPKMIQRLEMWYICIIASKKTFFFLNLKGNKRQPKCSKNVDIYWNAVSECFFSFVKKGVDLKSWCKVKRWIKVQKVKGLMSLMMIIVHLWVDVSIEYIYIYNSY